MITWDDAMCAKKAWPCMHRTCWCGRRRPWCDVLATKELNLVMTDMDVDGDRLILAEEFEERLNLAKHDMKQGHAIHDRRRKKRRGKKNPSTGSDVFGIICAMVTPTILPAQAQAPEPEPEQAVDSNSAHHAWWWPQELGPRRPNPDGGASTMPKSS